MTRDHIILIALSTLTATACLPSEDLFKDNRPLARQPGGDGGGAPDVKPPVPVPFGPKVIAYEYGSVSHDVDPGLGTTVTSSAAGGHDGPAPDTLFIKIANQPLSCSDPSQSVGDCGYWQAVFQLPTELHAPGIYTLEELDGFMLFNTADEEGFCGGGGGSFWDGTVEITAIDDEQVSGIIKGSSTWEFDINGPFVAHRCPLK
jgi:hypothetical protein